ncbi:hypothetical protein ABPG72_022063 [Tetrahymena utriculariae]
METNIQKLLSMSLHQLTSLLIREESNNLQQLHSKLFENKTNPQTIKQNNAIILFQSKKQKKQQQQEEEEQKKPRKKRKKTKNKNKNVPSVNYCTKQFNKKINHLQQNIQILINQKKKQINQQHTLTLSFYNQTCKKQIILQYKSNYQHLFIYVYEILNKIFNQEYQSINPSLANQFLQ